MRGKATGKNKRRKAARTKRTPPRPAAAEDRGEVVELAGEVTSRVETSPALTGGDLDADWQRAHLSGDEAVGGSVATPDQDIVDEIGHALGVEQPPEGEVRTSEEILRDRDDLRWHLERDAADEEEGRRAPRRERRPR